MTNACGLLSLSGVLACVLANPYAASAQATPSAPATQSATTPAATAPAEPQLEPQGYTYAPDGRRDLFVSMVRRGSDAQKPAIGATGTTRAPG